MFVSRLPCYCDQLLQIADIIFEVRVIEFRVIVNGSEEWEEVFELSQVFD
jgi:hypothetical protein